MPVSSEIIDRRAARRESTASVFRQSASSPARLREVRDAAVLEFLDVAEAVARRFAGRTHDGDDIRQVAYIGLVKAASRFDPEKGDDFVSFAVPTISGEIKRHLRDNGWVIRPPRRIQELRSRAATAGPRLAQSLGRSPSTRELAEHLGESVEDLREAHASQDVLSPMSLDLTFGEDESITLADAVGSADAGHAAVERAHDVRVAMRGLSARERRILHLRFFEDRTQQQIAGELGVTQMQVSRLLVKILARMRVALDGPEALPSIGAAAASDPQLELISA